MQADDEESAAAHTEGKVFTCRVRAHPRIPHVSTVTVDLVHRLSAVLVFSNVATKLTGMLPGSAYFSKPAEVADRRVRYTGLRSRGPCREIRGALRRPYGGQ